MITLEQVQELDAKIKQAVSLISTLREENAQLRSTLSNYENKITDLESMVLSLEDGQTKIELGLIDAISKLDNLDIVETKKIEDTSEELSPSDETEIVDLEITHENDHSEQVENITEESLTSKEEETKNISDDIVIEELDETEDESNSEITVLDEEDNQTLENDESLSEDIIMDNGDTENDSIKDINESSEAVETVTEDDIDVTEPVVEKKKSNDYSIPMLEIF